MQTRASLHCCGAPAPGPVQFVSGVPAGAAALPLPRNSGWPTRESSRRSRRTQARVFDKLKGLIQGGNEPQDTQAAAAAAAAGTDSFRLQRAGEGADEEDGAEMARIDPDSSGGLGGTSEQVLGPLAVLLVGFMQPEVEAFRAMMLDMEADMVKLVPCSRDMLEGTLLAAMQTERPQYEQPPLGQRRALFFSGMYGSEVTEVIAAYRDEGLPPCAFAALVPNNADRSVGELLEAVWADHAAMMAKAQAQQQGGGVADDSY